MMMIRPVLSKWPVLSTTVLTTSVWLIIFFSVALAGWPGQKSGCFDDYLTDPNCFCERPRRDALIAQPANTWSNLSFIVVALFISWSADAKTFPNKSWWEDHDNLITNHKWFVMAYASIASFLGPGSMFMHASFTHWGGTLDVISMFLFVGFAAVFVSTKLVLTLVGWHETVLKWAPLANALVYITLMSVMIWGYQVGAINGILLFEVFLYVSVGGEFLIRLIEWFVRKQRRANIWLYFLGVFFFGAAYAVWIPSRSGGAWCFPESVFQGHAVWHMLSALSVGTSFYFQLSEKSIIISLVPTAPFVAAREEQEEDERRVAYNQGGAVDLDGGKQKGDDTGELTLPV